MKLAHVVYMTHQIDEMLDWYLNAFEARVVHRADSIAFLTYDDEHHRFAFIDLGPAPEEGRRSGPPKVHHTAYTWADLDGLMTTFERLNDQGIRPATCLRHGPTLSMYYADPDGNQSEFQIDLLDPDAATEFMKSDAFAANPIGESFDPDELLAAFKAGQPLEALVFRSDQEPMSLTGTANAQ